MHHKAFQLHFIISLPFCQKKHIDYHACANLFNYPAILHLSKYSNRHLKLLLAQKSRKYTTPKLNFDLLHWCELFYYPAILHLFRHSKRRLKLLPAQNARNYTTPKPHSRKPPFPEVLLPYEFTLLQNLKRGYLKLLPVYVSQDIQLHFNISLPFCQKNILSAMLVQICSTTLQSCTSSNAQIGI